MEVLLVSRAKEDCFAYMETLGRPTCKALKEMYCAKEECKFYKNRKETNYVQIEKDIRNYSDRERK